MTVRTRSRSARASTAAVVAALLSAPVLSTNVARGQSLPAQAPAVSSGHCFMGNRAVRGATGATIGAWIGFVAAKIRMSDWSDESHTGSAIHARNQATIAGAAIGGIIGLLAPHHGCSALGEQASAHDRTSAAHMPIVAAEIQRNGLSGSVYDVVYSLRRSWLNDRGTTMSESSRYVHSEDGQETLVHGEPQMFVYLDNARLGTISELHNVSSAGVLEIRYWDQAQANLRWGLESSHGVIQVVTTLNSGAK